MDAQTRQEMEELDFSPSRHPRTFRRDYRPGAASSAAAAATSHSNNRRRNKNYKQLIIDESKRLASLREREKERLQAAAGGDGNDENIVIPVDFDGPTFINIEAPPSLMPRKHYCDITGLSGPYKIAHSGLRYHNKEIYKAIQELTPGVDQQYLELRNANVVLRLPLTASIDDDDDNDKQLSECKRQVKIIIRKLGPQSEPRASIEAGKYTIHYIISHNIIYLAICDKSYPRKLAFTYLDELDTEFYHLYSSQLDDQQNSANLRPYAFVQFDNFIQKTKRIYQDSRATQNLDKLNADLQDVTRVMTKNIEDLLYRGDSLDRMSHLSSSLKSESNKYRKAAVKINFDALIRQYAPIVGVSLMVVFLIWFMFLR